MTSAVGPFRIVPPSIEPMAGSNVRCRLVAGTLSVDDLAEEFSYVTFDGRFKALWPWTMVSRVAPP